MKKIFNLGIILILVLSLVGACSKKEEEKQLSDAEKFKEEYESVNGKTNDNGKDYRNLDISIDNPIVYKSAAEVIDMINNKETFIVYFGYNTCPWCRSVIATLFDVAKNNYVDKIYYVDIHDIRDTLELDDDDKTVKTSKEGSEDYYKLLEVLDNVLEDYTLTNSKGKTIKTNEKRIFAPNVVSIVKGEAKALDTGISSKQKDGYMELTEEMINETTKKFNEVFKPYLDATESCNEGC